jgi:hypothetical protein
MQYSIELQHRKKLKQENIVKELEEKISSFNRGQAGVADDFMAILSHPCHQCATDPKNTFPGRW